MTTTSACCDSCAPNNHDTALAIACTLGAGDFKDRVASIRDLARRSLLASRRDSLRLQLTYEVGALSEVRDLVAKESECCSFLAFDVQHNEQVTKLTITAPMEALAAADELFAHFAPELARQAA